MPNVIEIDTSARSGKMPSFQRIAYEVSTAMLTAIESHADQFLLVVDPIERSGFVDDMLFVRNVCEQAVMQPRLMRRTEAERTLTVQQLVPYGLIRDADDRVLVAKRRVEGERAELRGKWTMLFGGHAEQKDLNSGEPAGTFRRCLERELDEELIGVAVEDVRLVGLINDDQSALGSKHLAIVHEVAVGGRPGIRRQTADREFQRGGTEWRTKSDIARQVGEFDPWSQLVASKLFGASVRAQGGLFSPNPK